MDQTAERAGEQLLLCGEPVRGMPFSGVVCLGFAVVTKTRDLVPDRRVIVVGRQRTDQTKQTVGRVRRAILPPDGALGFNCFAVSCRCVLRQVALSTELISQNRDDFQQFLVDRLFPPAMLTVKAARGGRPARTRCRGVPP